MSSYPHRTDDRLLVARPIAVLGLAGIALIHLLDLPGKIQEVPYLGVAYIGLILTALGLAAVLLAREHRRDWLLLAALSGATVLGFVVDRATGLPMATADVGNWLEPLGLASLFVEITLLPLAAWAYRASAASSPAPARRPLQPQRV